MKVKLDWDEIYPVYMIILEDAGFYELEIELSEEEIDRIKKANIEFWQTQALLEKARSEAT